MKKMNEIKKLKIAGEINWDKIRPFGFHNTLDGIITFLAKGSYYPGICVINPTTKEITFELVSYRNIDAAILLIHLMTKAGLLEEQEK